MPSWKAAAIITVVSGCLVTHSYGADVTLQWNANAESDLLGYKVYYQAGPSAPPYTGSGASEGDSPILVDADYVTMGDVCRFTLSGLTSFQTYYFVVTAYDSEWNESDYSNEVCFNCRSEYECNLTPNTFVVQRGETLGIDIIATNRTNQYGTVFFGTKLTIPNGQIRPHSGYLWGPFQVYLKPHESKSAHISHTVPMDWPLGDNIYHGYVSIPDVGNLHECQFVVKVIEAQ